MLLSSYTVNTLSDAVNPGPGLLSLRQAIRAANTAGGADTIEFSPTLFPAGSSTITLTQGELFFTDTTGVITLAGPGEEVLTVSASNASRVFDIAGGVTVSLSGLTVADGLAPEGADQNFDGGGISNAGTLSLDDVRVTSCQAATYGGGIYSSGSLTITDSAVDGDSVGLNSEGFGGGVYAATSVTVTDSSITNDSAGEQGGGIYSAGTATLDQATVEDNLVSVLGQASLGEGGGICANDLTLEQSTVSGNYVETFAFTSGVGTPAYGGGVAATGTLLISYTTIMGNDASTSNGTYAVQGGGNATGAGIYATSTTTISYSTIADNRAVAGSAGTETDPSYDGSIPGNGGAADGGGIALDAAATPIIDHSTVADNEALGGSGANGPGNGGGSGGEGAGGGVYSVGPYTLVDSTISGNSASGGNGGNATVYLNPPNSMPFPGGNGGDGAGGISCNQNIQVFDSTISGNSGVGGLGGQGTSYNGSSSRNGYAGTGDGGVFANTLLLDNSIVSGNFGADVSATDSATGSNNLIGIGTDLTNGVNSNVVGVTNPMLSPLGNYGGPTQTMLPLPGSPAIDEGNNSLIPSGITTDQRGYARIFDSTVDIGGDEYGASAPFASSTKIMSSYNSITAGAAVTLTATVSAAGGEVAPTGIVGFTDNRVAFGSAIVQEDGTATLTTSSLPVGTDMITASYGGDSTHSASTSGTFQITVTQPPLPPTPSITTVTSISPNPAPIDTPVTVMGIIAASSQSGPTPTGSVTIYDGSSNVGVATVQNGGSFSLSTSALPAATDSITASYSGDSVYADSTSLPFMETVLASTVVPAFGNAFLPVSVVTGLKVSSELPVTITNVDVSLKGKFTINLYLSINDRLDGSQLLLGTKKKNILLKTGKAQLFNFKIRSLPAALAVGKYHVLAEVIDPTGAINVTATTQTMQVVAAVIKPMVTIGPLSPLNIEQGKSGSILITVTNSGNVAATNVGITLSPSSDGVAPVAGVILESVRSGAKIRPNKSKIFKLHFKVPSALSAGSYFPYVAVSLGDTSTTDVATKQFMVS